LILETAAADKFFRFVAGAASVTAEGRRQRQKAEAEGRRQEAGAREYCLRSVTGAKYLYL